MNSLNFWPELGSAEQNTRCLVCFMTKMVLACVLTATGCSTTPLSSSDMQTPPNQGASNSIASPQVPVQRIPLTNPKDVVSAVLKEKQVSLSNKAGLGKEIVALGEPALQELIAGLTNNAASEQGYIALAIALFEQQARPVVPQLIALYPTEPQVDKVLPFPEIPSVELLDSFIKLLGRGGMTVTANLTTSGVFQSLNTYFYLPKAENPAAQLVDKLKGMLDSTGENVVFERFGPNGMQRTTVPKESVLWGYKHKSPAAAEALQAITGTYQGITQEAWQEWLKKQN